jgi:molecular chaperone DnaJ
LDLYTVAMVPFPLAAMGGTLDLEMLDGAREKVQILEGTQGGTVLTLDHKGLRDGRGRKGHLHVLVQIQVPTKLTAKQRDALRALQQEWGGPPPRANLREALQGWLGKRAEPQDEPEE